MDLTDMSISTNPVYLLREMNVHLLTQSSEHCLGEQNPVLLELIDVSLI